MRETEIAVVGAGPAGLAAAVQAAQAGANVTLIDEHDQPGGQYFKPLPSGFRGNGRPDWAEDEEKGKTLLRQITSERIAVLSGTSVIALSPDRVMALAQATHHVQLRAQKVILACGAYERPIPFPGWTLPGVMSAGAVQMLVKIQRVLPAKRILVVGSGPLLVLTASMLADAGAQVVALVEAAPMKSLFRQLPYVWQTWRTLLRGGGYVLNLIRAGVPILAQHTIVRAEGQGQVEHAFVAAVDREWRPLAGTEREYEADAICVSFGFLPSTELPQLAGCEMKYDSKMATFVPVHNDEMETSLPGIFVAGETAGIGGAGIGLQQGKIAGAVAAKQLGRTLGEKTERQLRGARQELAKLDRFHDSMDRVYGLRRGIWSLMTEDTIICRCNEVTKAELREAAEESTMSLRELKLRTYAGMGSCQSRFCGDILMRILAATKRAEVDRVPLPRSRPPARTVSVEALAREIE